MQKADNLAGLLSETVKSMTSEQVKVFRAELIKTLPVTVRKCSKKAKISQEKAEAGK